MFLVKKEVPSKQEASPLLSSSSISQFITIITLSSPALVLSIYDSTEVAIQKMIETSQRMITINNSNQGIEGVWGGMNPATKKHLELEIKTLQNAPRDPDKLERLLKLKERQKERRLLRSNVERLSFL
jgi:hypothetical protein